MRWGGGDERALAICVEYVCMTLPRDNWKAFLGSHPSHTIFLTFTPVPFLFSHLSNMRFSFLAAAALAAGAVIAAGEGMDKLVRLWLRGPGRSDAVGVGV